MNSWSWTSGNISEGLRNTGEVGSLGASPEAHSCLFPALPASWFVLNGKLLSFRCTSTDALLKHKGPNSHDGNSVSQNKHLLPKLLLLGMFVMVVIEIINTVYTLLCLGILAPSPYTTLPWNIGTEPSPVDFTTQGDAMQIHGVSYIPGTPSSLLVCISSSSLSESFTQLWSASLSCHSTAPAWSSNWSSDFLSGC